MKHLSTNERRRAISILELMLVMSASTVVLSLSGVLLHRAMLVQIQSRSRTHVENTSLRLAHQFRTDVHAAREAKPDNAHGAAGVFLHLAAGDDRTIEYSRENGNVLRLETGGNQPSRREVFEFPPAAQLVIEQLNAPNRLALTIQLRAPEQPSASNDIRLDMNPVPVSLHVEAAIGRDLQLHQPPAITEASP